MPDPCRCAQNHLSGSTKVWDCGSGCWDQALHVAYLSGLRNRTIHWSLCDPLGSSALSAQDFSCSTKFCADGEEVAFWPLSPAPDPRSVFETRVICLVPVRGLGYAWH